MNKQVSATFSFVLILVLSIAVSTYAIAKNKELAKLDSRSAQATMASANNAKKIQITSNCKTRAFEGSAEIYVWKAEKDGQEILQLDKNDLAQLPIKDTETLKLIDPTPDISKELEGSSEKNPVKLKISGFADKCDGVSLVALSYKDGIFKPYLN